LLALPKVKAVEADLDPTAPTGHGFIQVCECGKVFQRDTWRLQEYVAGADGLRYWVSTVHLELNHGFMGPELWFETMVIGPDGEFLDYQDRYSTRAEAEAGHLLAISKVRDGAIHPLAEE
jgi:hypothetical protein